ncbi:hypothetical protein, partial [Treponema sp.]|uniref:hypothetical protein n=1 Tax=Treponema sp. TaxID=166 RepID=UPI003F0931F9
MGQSQKLWENKAFGFRCGANSTGIVPPGWAFSRGLLLNDKVDYYVVKRNCQMLWMKNPEICLGC